MLVLSRNTEQTIMIGDDIEIKVVEIRGGKVKLGITAPQNVSVHLSWHVVQVENVSLVLCEVP